MTKSRRPPGDRVILLIAVALMLGPACGKTQVVTTYNVFAQEFQFHGMPERIEAGLFAIDFSNQELFPVAHELILVRIPAGKTAFDIVKTSSRKSCRQGAACEKIWEHIGDPLTAQVGASKEGQFRLPPGTYGFACWLNGTTQGGQDGPAHASLGMVYQFTVNP